MAVRMLDFTRQSTLVPSEISSLSTSIIGVGSIGSHLAEVLSKTGISDIVMYDGDTVESHNLPNQGYYLPELGAQKVTALKSRLEAGTGVAVTARAVFYLGGNFGTKVVVSALDSMAARKLVFSNFLLDPDTLVFIDGRMGSRFGKVFVVSKDNNDSVAEYLSSLHTDADAATEPCTARSTIFCAYVIAGIMAASLVSWVLEEKYPFQTAIDLVSMRTTPFAR
jgi:molybdopterin/thiamine biosynthesis adenylyltransferase